MHPNHSPREYQQRRVHTRAANTDSYDFFNLLTSSQLLNDIESLLPDHRERLFPPTETLSMFLAQALSADRSCQKAEKKMEKKWKKNGVKKNGVRHDCLMLCFGLEHHFG